MPGSLYSMWHTAYPRREDLHTGHRVERELTGTALAQGVRSAAAVPGVEHRIGDDGQTRVDLRPPTANRGAGAAGVVVGLGFVGLAAWTVLSEGRDLSVGAAVGAVAMVVLGVGFALLMLGLSTRWILDADGIHRIGGLGARTTSWSEVHRVRLVAAPARGRTPAERSLCFLDSTGRALTHIGYTTPSRNPRTRATNAPADLGHLLAIAGECHHRGWLPLSSSGDDATELMEAAASDVQELERLLAARPELEARDSEGMTALHWAASWGEPDAVLRLLSAGADIEARTDYGFSPFWMAQRRDRPTVEALRSAGASLTLPPLEPVRYSARHWIPVLATWFAGVVAALAVALLAGWTPAWEDRVAQGVLTVVGFVATLRVLRPALFWSGGVPVSQNGAALVVRRPWGRRMVVDLGAVSAAHRSPARCYRPGSIRGAGVLLVVKNSGWSIGKSRLPRLRLAAADDHVRSQGTRGLLVVLDPADEQTVLANMVGWMMDNDDARVDPQLYERPRADPA